MPCPVIICSSSLPYSCKSSSNPSTSPESTGRGPTRLGLSQIDTLIQKLMDNGIAMQVHPVCLPIRLASVPQVLPRADSSPTPTLRTHPVPIRCSNVPNSLMEIYLSALHYFQICAGLPDPSLSSFTHLIYILKGIHRINPEHSQKHRLPINLLPSIESGLYHLFSMTMLCCGWLAVSDSCVLGNSPAQRPRTPHCARVTLQWIHETTHN